MVNIDDMLSLVDFDGFMESVKVTSERVGDIDESVVRWYLEEWAKAKLHIFEVFGGKLTLEKEVDMIVDEDAIYEEINGLAKRYPKYAAQILDFHADEWKKNEVDTRYNHFTSFLFPTICKKSAKPSKIMSKILQDEQFDIELSKILQNRTIKGKCVVSIHPLDYVTVSTCNHKWGSCMHILEGFNKFGGYSLMLDNESMIAYSHTGKIVTYKNKWGSFDWNNKDSRQIIYLNPEHNRIAMGHYNGTPSDSHREIWVKLIKNQIPGEWKYSEKNVYARKMGSFYYNYENYGNYVRDGAEAEPAKMGVKSLRCVVCGKEFTNLVGYHGWLTCNEHGEHDK